MAESKRWNYFPLSSGERAGVRASVKPQCSRLYITFHNKTMNRRRLTCLALVLLAATVSHAAQYEHILNFDSHIQVETDGTLDVIETIQAYKPANGTGPSTPPRPQWKGLDSQWSTK